VAIKNADPRPGGPVITTDSADGASGGDLGDEKRGTAATAEGERRSLIYRPYRIGRNWSATQVLSGLLIAGVCVVGVIWYVPRVMSTDRRSLTGSVTSNGVLTLNFQNSGVISVIKVQPNEAVHKGQVLAVEYAPTMGAVIAADNAAISAVQTKIAELKSNAVTYPLYAAEDQAEIASQNADMATDEARLDSDRVKLAETEIIAPSDGVVVAANGQAGESVTSSGIRNYQSSAQTQGSQEPAFSLLPEGPQSSSHSSTFQASLPVVTLRVSSAWSVVAYIGETSVSSIKSGEPVTVSVPAAGIKDVPGLIQQVLPDPVESSSGPLYEAMVTITSSVASPPLNEMAANIELSS